MQRLAQEKGGRCLSDNYINNATKLRWECAEEHVWEATPAGIISGKWCLKCSGREKLTIEQMQEAAQARGGKCLSDIYVNARKKLEWQCAKGHKWFTIPDNVINKNSWCPKCAGLANRKWTIEQMQELATHRGGKCLSAEYKGWETKLKWECAKGHIWLARPGNIKTNNAWCLKCSGKKKPTIEEMQMVAKAKGGKCLSAKYMGRATKLKWECSKGHRWWAMPAGIKIEGNWCPECAVLNRTGTIEEMEELAKTKGGKCLSTVYISAMHELYWECTNGHIWQATPERVKRRGYWCIECTNAAKGKRQWKKSGSLHWRKVVNVCQRNIRMEKRNLNGSVPKAIDGRQLQGTLYMIPVGALYAPGV